jgi:hypothetical protein
VITNDSGTFTAILSKQIIQACVRHVFIGSINWIISSLEQSTVLDHFPFEILRDKKSSKNSRGIKQCRFDQLPVFPSSCIISIECLTGITLIILCNTKKEMLNRKNQYDENLSRINEKNIYYCKPEFLFDSIVRHEVQAMEKYLW